MKAMPKGALLHAHFEAMYVPDVILRLSQILIESCNSSCDFSTFLNIAISLDNGLVHVVTPTALTLANVHDVFPEFRILHPESPPALVSTDPSASLTSPAYKPGEWIPLQVARRNFKLPPWTSNDLNCNVANKVMLQRLSGLEGAEAFDTWAAACATLDPAEAHETRNTVDEVRYLFKRVKRMTSNGYMILDLETFPAVLRGHSWSELSRTYIPRVLPCYFRALSRRKHLVYRSPNRFFIPVSSQQSGQPLGHSWFLQYSQFYDPCKWQGRRLSRGMDARVPR
jgi:hypothetical protein